MQYNKKHNNLLCICTIYIYIYIYKKYGQHVFVLYDISDINRVVYRVHLQVRDCVLQNVSERALSPKAACDMLHCREQDSHYIMSQ